MGFLNTDSMPRLVEKLSDGDNIKITGNSKGNRVGTVVKKIVEKADDVTKAIEQEVINDSYSFKVGTGNVDVSADVEDGFGEVGIKGVTYQNVLPVGMFDSKENFYALGGQVSDLHSSFDGGYITLNATGDYGNAFVKLEKTLLKQNSKYTLILDIKNTTLTLKEEANPNNSSFAVASAHPSEAFVDWCFLGGNAYPLKNGIQKFLLTTKSDFTGVNWSTRMFVSDNVASGSITFRFLLLEGDHTNNPNLPSYFEGIVGIGDKSKNLFNPTTVKNNVGVDISNGNEVANAIRKYSDFIDVIPSKYSFEVEGNCKFINIFVFDSNKNLICATHGNGTLVGDIKGTIDFSKEIFKGVKYIRILLANSTETNIVGNEVYNFYLNIGESVSSKYQYYDGYKIEILSNGKNLFDYSKKIDGYYWSSEGTSTVHPNSFLSEKYIKVSNGEVYATNGNTQVLEYNVNKEFIQRVQVTQTKYNVPSNVSYIRVSYFNHGLNFEAKFEKDVISAEFEYSKEDKTQILLDEPLMRLPNSICDEITRDGKLIRRVGKYIFTGDENINSWITTGENTYGVGFKDLSFGLGSYNYIEILSTILPNKSPSSINGTNDIEGIALWDNGNFVRFRVNRAKLGSQDVAGVKKWLKNLYQQGTPLTIYYKLSEPIITELPAPYLRIFKDGHLTFNTLVAPESNHVVQLNKSAQIERSIREVQSLDSRVGKLESFYDDMMLETNHKLSLLDYDFEYTRSLKESEDI